MVKRTRRGTTPLSILTCSACGKKAYQDKKDAVLALRRNHPGAKGMTAYRCSRGGSLWHVGHTDVVERERLERDPGRELATMHEEASCGSG